MMRLLPIALALVGCEGNDTCELSAIVAEDFAGIEAEDCGSVQINDNAGLQAARACVQTALADSRPFYVLFELQGIDSRIVRGYAADANMLYAYIYDNFSGASATRSRCDSLVELTPCDGQQLEFHLCFMCTGEMQIERCEE